MSVERKAERVAAIIVALIGGALVLVLLKAILDAPAWAATGFAIIFYTQIFLDLDERI